MDCTKLLMPSCIMKMKPTRAVRSSWDVRMPYTFRRNPEINHENASKTHIIKNGYFLLQQHNSNKQVTVFVIDILFAESANIFHLIFLPNLTVTCAVATLLPYIKSSTMDGCFDSLVVDILLAESVMRFHKKII